MFNTVTKVATGWVANKALGKVKGTSETLVEYAILYGESKVNNLASEYLLKSYKRMILGIVLYFITFIFILLSHAYEIMPKRFVILINIMYGIILIRMLIKYYSSLMVYMKHKKLIHKYLGEFVWFITVSRSKDKYTANKYVAVSKEYSKAQKLRLSFNERADWIMWGIFLRCLVWDLICFVIKPRCTYDFFKKVYGEGLHNFFVNAVNNEYQKNTKGWHRWLFKIMGSLEVAMSPDDVVDKLYKHTCKVIQDIFKKKVLQYLFLLGIITISFYIMDQFMLRYILYKSKFDMILDPVRNLF